MTMANVYSGCQRGNGRQTHGSLTILYLPPKSSLDNPGIKSIVYHVHTLLRWTECLLVGLSDKFTMSEVGDQDKA